MNIKERLKRWSKLRFAIIYPLSVFIVFFSVPDDRSIMSSVSFIIAGLAVRIWANGYAIKMDKLTTSGPYAFVRHPLYLGTILIAIGFIVMLKIYLAGAMFLILMVAVYRRTIQKEENMLIKKFNGTYAAYKRKIPAVLPTVFHYKEGEKWSFSLRRLIRSQEYKVFLWVMIIMITFHLKDEFMIEHELMDSKIWFLIVIAFVLGLTDLIGELFKKRLVKKELIK
ncbi:MAG: isoprenylcysteine carboxylmethyltransferase family protein [Candidatus Omnitrophica bacterium]|nr:isoprenylcysteine carboxylmethyltransferase family protein [Candidatus Omnitrophota bacterium]